MGNLAALIAAIEKIAPLVVEAATLLEQAIPASKAGDFITKLESIAQQLQTAINSHKAAS